MDMETRTPMIIPESKAFETVEVLWVKHWNDRLFSFAVTRPRSFRFRSGEFIMIGMPVDGKPLVRAYSVCSPAYAEELEFLSIKVEDGPLTSRLQSIEVGDQLYLGRKPTGTLVSEALRPGKRLFLLSTGTGLAPFLSIIRDPDIYERFDDIILTHSVRQVSDLAFYDELLARLKDDPLVEEEAAKQFHYVPTVTREDFRNNCRIDKLIENGTLFVEGPKEFDPENDRVMMCGSMEMIKDFSAYFEGLNFEEGSNAKPGDFVIERAFVG